MRTTRRDFFLATATAAAAAACSPATQTDTPPRGRESGPPMIGSEPGKGGAALTVPKASDSVNTPMPTTPHQTPTASDAARAHEPHFERDPFTLGIASGDPSDESVVLWTRLAPDPFASEGGMPDISVEISWAVARDASFETLVASGTEVAVSAFAHSVHAVVGGLEPNTTYHYRFMAADWTSPTGTTRTLPKAQSTVDRFRFAVTCCQDLQFGRFAAWRDVADDGDVSLVVFLGDYIYELPPLDLTPEHDGSRTWRNARAIGLDEYRLRYAQVKTDESLQRAHATVPWVVMWDDHEVCDNYTAFTNYSDPNPEEFAARRAAAYQAWYEHQPVRLPPPMPNAPYPVCRSFDVGDLATVVCIETRQFADPTPCRNTSDRDTGTDCEERHDPARSLLGHEQASWLEAELQSASNLWTVLCNPVLFSGIDVSLGTSTPTYYLDAWDGYTAERDHVVELLKKCPNPIILTGDYHASIVLDSTDNDGNNVAPEFVAPAISSMPFAAPMSGNPHVRYANATNGYMVCQVTREEWTTEFRHVVDIWKPESELNRETPWHLVVGQRTASGIG